MKPTLFLNVGTGWSGTTPLYYTLGWYNNYCHAGHRKEKGYLWLLQLQRDNNTFERIKFYKKFFGPSRQSTTTRKPKIFTHESKYVAGKWTEEEIEYFWGPPFDLAKYVQYYLKHWDNIKDDYKAVADFSNPNGYCDAEYIKYLAYHLQSYFDVKIHMIFRDPIRRLWSCRQAQKRDKPVEHFLKSGMDFDYIDFYNKWADAFGNDNTHVTIMEDFWAGETSLLSGFIGMDIKETHVNAYVPDLGPCAPHIQYLNDQWESDVMHMPDHVKDKAKIMLEPCYSNWKQYFGKLPESWGK